LLDAPEFTLADKAARIASPRLALAGLIQFAGTWGSHVSRHRHPPLPLRFLSCFLLVLLGPLTSPFYPVPLYPVPCRGAGAALGPRLRSEFAELPSHLRELADPSASQLPRLLLRGSFRERQAVV